MLQRLPANMRIIANNDDTDEPTVFVNVYNIDHDTVHVCIDEYDMFSNFHPDDSDEIAEE